MRFPVYLLPLFLSLSFAHDNSVYVHYGEKKSRILQKRMELKNRLVTAPHLKDSILEVASNYFFESLHGEIIPAWYGTKWDFNGYTNIPNQGTIACGYFVSTTLKHMSVNINRYRMAQQSALSEIKTIDEDYTVLKAYTPDMLHHHMQENMKDGIYIIGLDSHVGFLVQKGSDSFFIHSNYLTPAKVVREEVKHSQALENNSAYYIGKISTSKSFIENWINAKEIKVVMDKW